jgi:hypothetical protein
MLGCCEVVVRASKAIIQGSKDQPRDYENSGVVVLFIVYRTLRACCPCVVYYVTYGCGSCTGPTFPTFTSIWHLDGIDMAHDIVESVTCGKWKTNRNKKRIQY